MLVDGTGKPKDFSYLDLNQYGHALVCREYDSYSALLDSFYSERDRIDRMHQRGADLLKLLVNLSDRDGAQAGRPAGGGCGVDRAGEAENLRRPHQLEPLRARKGDALRGAGKLLRGGRAEGQDSA